MTTIAFHFLGCRLNEAENELHARAFVEAGHRMVSIEDNPDVIVLNTCGVTCDAMRKSRNLARRMAALKPEILVLMGCAIDLMASGENPMEDEELQNEFSQNADPDKKMRIIRILRDDRPKTAQIVLNAIDELQSDKVIDEQERALAAASYRLRMRSFIKIQDGCNNQCTYCAVRLARGRERSEETSHIIDEIRKCLALGEREIVLTGVQLGAWKENDRRLKDLISDILEQTDVQRMRIGSIEPWHVRPELWALWANDKRLCPHFHIPVQSGSDGVLTAMKRRTPIDGYLEKIQAMRNEIPNVRISTDIIVGFPGETDEMWQETMEFFRLAQFDEAHLFRYSPRPNTIAASLPNQISAEIKRKRWNEAEKLILEIQKQRFEASFGLKCRVLWENLIETRNGLSHWVGYSENYLRIERWFDERKNMRGEITEETFEARDSEYNYV